MITHFQGLDVHVIICRHDYLCAVSNQDKKAFVNQYNTVCYKLLPDFFLDAKGEKI